MIDALIRSRWAKPVVFLACAEPAVMLVRAFLHDDLGPNPTEELLASTGQTAFFLLLTSLAITPLRRLLHLNGLQRFRRMLGVWAFTYALTHLSLYLLLDQACISWAACDGGLIAKDLLRRPFIFVGMLAFTILLMLAITSTNGWMRRLGRNWQALHRLVYVAASAAIVHFIWKQKADISEPLRWMWVLVALLGVRLYFAIQKRLARRATTTTGASRITLND